MKLIKQLNDFYVNVLKDKRQTIAIKKIEDIEKTEVKYGDRVKNEMQVFSNKPRTDDVHESSQVCSGEVDESGKIAAPRDNHFLLEFIMLDRRLSSYKGLDFWSYIADFANTRKFTKILSIGAGTCSVEIEIAKNITSDYQIDCVDINPEILQRGQSMADQLGLKIKTIIADVHDLSFRNEYDLVISLAGIHHFINFEKIFMNISNAINPGGEFVLYEPICKSGMFLNRRQRLVLGFLFLFLPERYRVNNIDYLPETRVDRYYHEVDRSLYSFECIRSGDIASSARKYFKTKHWGRGATFLRRIADPFYGLNYDWTNEQDVRMAKFILKVDVFCRNTRFLPPENLFFIGKKKMG